MDFLNEVNRVCEKARQRSVRENRLTVLSADPNYWRREQAKAKAGLTYAILAPFIFVPEDSNSVTVHA